MRSTLAALVLFVATALAAPAAEPIRHRFLVVDNGGNRLVLVDQREPAKGWSVAIPGGSRDLQLIGKDRVLCSHGNGAGEYRLADGAQLWKVDAYKGVSTARRLPGGSTLLGAAEGGATIIELDAAGKEAGRLPVPQAKDLRLMRRLDNGNLLLGLAGPHAVLEIDAQGKTVAELKLSGKGYVALRLPSGSTLASNGDSNEVVELDAQGKVVSAVGGAKHKDARLLWASGFDLLDNGNIVLANWCGHGKHGQGPHVVEFTRANELVWQWEDHQAAKTVTNVLVLDGRE
jgi:hypothetical protein